MLGWDLWWDTTGPLRSCSGTLYCTPNPNPSSYWYYKLMGLRGLIYPSPVRGYYNQTLHQVKHITVVGSDDFTQGVQRICLYRRYNVLVVIETVSISETNIIAFKF